jgi:hypothetical protein
VLRKMEKRTIELKFLGNYPVDDGTDGETAE